MVMGLLTKLKKNWFLEGILAVISLASFWPEIGAKGGILRPEYTVKYGAVSIIFFNSGLSLKSEELKRALLHVRLHIFVQSFTLCFVPLFVCFLVKLISKLEILDPWIITGFQVVSCMPPPVSSAVILTKSAGGNEAAAIFNSAFGSFLGIFVTPSLLLYFLGSEATVPISQVFTQLSCTVVLPLLIGQFFRSRHKAYLEQTRIPFGTISSAILLLVIYTTFCDTFLSKGIDMELSSLILIIVMVVLLQGFLLLLTFTLSKKFTFLPEDTVTIIFCSTHKSLTLGIPMLKILFGSHPHLSMISLPLLVYHPVQILLGGLLVPSVRKWMESAQRKLSLHLSTV